VNSTSALPTRRQRKRQATIDEILQAARLQMRRDGAGALNLNAVAREVGLRTPSLYAYFPGGKNELLDALFRMGIERLDALLQPVWALPDPAARLERGMAVYLRFAVESPELYQICYERPVPDFVPSAESMRRSLALLSELHAVSTALLAHAPNPLNLTADSFQNLILATMHGIAALHLANEPHLPPGAGRFGSLLPVASAILHQALYVLPGPSEQKRGEDA
jgi:AcrR family transcriptional regulator